MNKKIENDWFTVDGSLKEIDFKGDNHFRFCDEVAELVLNTYSKVGDSVIDPFAGFGTTLHVAQRIGRTAIGFEIDKERAEFANKGLRDPNKVVCGDIQSVDFSELPEFDLLFTSPPYVTVNLEDDPWGEGYFEDMMAIFFKIKKTLKKGANIVVEVSNINTEDGFRPLPWQLGEILSEIFKLKDVVVRCNTGENQAGPGVNHSYLLVFKN